MTNTNQLSAILFCDIQGYTSLMQKDEIQTLQLLTKFQQTLSRLVAQYDGEIVKYFGDSGICLFPSAVKSVACAIEIQQALRQSPVVPLRIGLNLGDVHRTGDDVFGDAVNITSRIESMGVAGNILVSQSLHQKVKNHPEFNFRSLGKFSFKNVDDKLEVFALANEGITVPRRRDLHGKFKKKNNRIKRLWPASILVLASLFYFIQKNIWGGDARVESIEGNQIAVVNFENNTGDKKYDIAGKMAADWIVHGIAQNKVAQVISPKIVEDYSKILNASIGPSMDEQDVTDYLKPTKIIKGQFYLNKNRLLFQCSITDEVQNTILISFPPVECDADVPLDCIEELNQRILGYLVTERKSGAKIQEIPPKYEAYQFLLKAKQEQALNEKEYLRLLDEAISADSTFFEAKTYKLIYYYNKGKYTVANSLLKELLVSAEVNARQRDLFSRYKALLEGDSKNTFIYEQMEYNIAPLDIETNSSMMTISLQVVNKPLAVDSIYRKISMDGIDLKQCDYCEDRYYIKALTDIALHNYDDAITLLGKFANDKENNKLRKILIRAQIKKGNYQTADSLLYNVQTTSDNNTWMEVFLFNAKDFILQDQQELANKYLDAIVKNIDDSAFPSDLSAMQMLGESLFLYGKYQPAEEVLTHLVRIHPDVIKERALLAITLQKNGHAEEAKSQLQALDGKRGPFQYGSVDYALAQYYAAISDEDNMNKYLIRAVSDGHWYGSSNFQNDPFFKEYIETSGFERIMNFWH